MKATANKARHVEPFSVKVPPCSFSLVYMRSSAKAQILPRNLGGWVTLSIGTSYYCGTTERMCNDPVILQHVSFKDHFVMYGGRTPIPD